MVNDILRGMENQEITAVVILNLYPTFDKVNHDILLTVLKNHFGIDGEVIKWFENYLRSRCFKVCIADRYSSSKELKFSIPQGSCSGANVFTFYCPLITDIIPGTIIINGFAADHSTRKKYKGSNGNQEIRTKEEPKTTVTNIKNWMDTICLKLNLDKREYIKWVKVTAIKINKYTTEC